MLRIGDGFESCRARGSHNNDLFSPGQGDSITDMTFFMVNLAFSHSMVSKIIMITMMTTMKDDEEDDDDDDVCTP